MNIKFLRVEFKKLIVASHFKKTANIFTCGAICLLGLSKN